MSMQPPSRPTPYKHEQLAYSGETAAKVRKEYDQLCEMARAGHGAHVSAQYQRYILSQWLDDGNGWYHKPPKQFFDALDTIFTEEVLTGVFIETLTYMIEELYPLCQRSVQRLAGGKFKCKVHIFTPLTFHDHVERGQAMRWSHLYHHRDEALGAWVGQKQRWVDGLITLRDEVYHLTHMLRLLEAQEIRFQQAWDAGQHDNFVLHVSFFPRRRHQGP